MEIQRLCYAMAMFALIVALMLPSINSQVPGPAPPPSSDGLAIDQGIAYLLMLLALVLTYIIH